MSTAIVCMLNHTAIKEQMISTSLLSTSLQNDMSFNTTYNTTEHYIETGPVCHFKELVGKEADAVNKIIASLISNLPIYNRKKEFIHCNFNVK